MVIVGTWAVCIVVRDGDSKSPQGQKIRQRQQLEDTTERPLSTKSRVLQSIISHLCRCGDPTGRGRARSSTAEEASLETTRRCGAQPSEAGQTIRRRARATVPEFSRVGGMDFADNRTSRQEAATTVCGGKFSSCRRVSWSGARPRKCVHTSLGFNV